MKATSITAYIALSVILTACSKSPTEQIVGSWSRTPDSKEFFIFEKWFDEPGYIRGTAKSPIENPTWKDVADGRILAEQGGYQWTDIEHITLQITKNEAPVTYKVKVDNDNLVLFDSQGGFTNYKRRDTLPPPTSDMQSFTHWKGIKTK